MYRKDLDAVRPKLPQYFGLLPKAQLEVNAVPAYSEKEQAPADYQRGTPTARGRARSTSYLRLRAPFARERRIDRVPRRHPRPPLADFHCAGADGLPQFRKYAGYTAYTEAGACMPSGWAKDMGFYQDPYSEYGRLETDIFRAVRLVVDTGCTRSTGRASR